MTAITKEYFDLIVIIPLEEELLAFEKEFPVIENRSTTTSLRHVVDGETHDFRILAVQQEGMGKSCATQTSLDILAEFDVGLIVCLGIAGSLSGDMKLGDVCYSGDVIDIYDNAKVITGEDGIPLVQWSPTHFKTQREITSAINYVRTQPDLKEGYAAWQARQRKLANSLVPNSVVGRKGKEELITEPSTKNGTIVCGPVSQSEKFNERLRLLDRKLLAIETEAGGVFQSADAKKVPALVMRGICDYADEKKNDLEHQSSNGVRELAARNAASFLKYQLANPHFHTSVLERRNGAQGVLGLAPPAAVMSVVSTVLALIGNAIDDRLRELSPEFKLQPKGYQLPLPRVKKVEKQSSVDRPSYSEPMDVREALVRHRTMFLSIPRTYPDQSLAWIIAYDLIVAEYDGKQAVPIVIDGNAIRPPNSGLLASSGGTLKEVDGQGGVQPIIIIENIPLNSKTRLKFLADEVALYPTAKFVFITRGEANLVFEADFATLVAADVFHICDISFVEIAHFIQKNFSMSGSEAEVIALRLRETFNRFSLSAHPTYFAGIPKEMLSALLQANRRSELIQLAVDGFLTFVVAGDSADVTLSRTTRSRFLRRLIVELKLEKRAFTQADVVKFADEFSKEHDFDIKPLAFVHDFISKGIMHFEDDRVRMSLPFIESYLLAVELRDHPNKAKRYFGSGYQDFDLAAFDIYAEVGASRELIDKIVDDVENAIATLQPTDAAWKHVLLTNEIQPRILDQGTVATIREQLRTASDDIRKRKDNAHRKQRLLDTSDRVQESAAKRRRDLSDKSEKDGNGTGETSLNAAIAVWSVATVLLGQGAEHLDAITKRRLAGKIIALASLIIDAWTRNHLKIDFTAMKEEVLNDNSITSLLADVPNQDHKKIISALVDIFEFAALFDPLRQILGFMCEQARQKVLGPSVERAGEINGEALKQTPHGFVAANEIEGVIHGTWLADIDIERGKYLKDAIKGLPHVPFTRFALASHLLGRVYWRHWDEKSRNFLIDAAGDAFEPLPINIDKGRLKREFKKLDDATPPTDT